MSAYFQHTDHKIFPNPHEFNPDRWLSNVAPAMKKNYIIATMVCPGAVDFEIFEITELDLKPT